MAGKILVMLALLTLWCSTSYGAADRWQKLVEDDDLAYYIDERSILHTRTGTTVFWVKQMSRTKDFLKKQYQMNNLDYILFNYEIDCEKGMYKSRGLIYYDREGTQIDKQVPLSVDMSDAEPIPPESIMEIVQDYVCSAGEDESVPQRQPVLPEAAPAPSQAPELPSSSGPGLP